MENQEEKAIHENEIEVLDWTLFKYYPSPEEEFNPISPIPLIDEYIQKSTIIHYKLIERLKREKKYCYHHLKLLYYVCRINGGFRICLLNCDLKIIVEKMLAAKMNGRLYIVTPWKTKVIFNSYGSTIILDDLLYQNINDLFK